MSLFGEHLKTIIDTNKINIYGLAKSAGLERTFIHKIMSDGRIPSDEYVSRLADALPLTPEERLRLMESFNVSKIGEFKHRQRIQVKDLIESMAHIESEDRAVHCGGVIGNSLLSDTNTTAIGGFAVNNLVKSAIEETIGCEGRQELDFVIPESYQYFYHELLVSFVRHPQMQIRHIVAFSKKIDFIQKTNRNLDLLSLVLPFAFVPGTGYCPYYFYRASNDAELTQAMPYFVLTPTDKLVLISKEFNKAVLICDGGIVSLYRDSFKAMLEQATPLMRRLNSIFEVLNHYIDTDITDTGEPYHMIEPEPCIGQFATDELWNQHVRQEIENRETLVGLFLKHLGLLRKNQLRTINACTTDGLSRIISTGHTYYAPQELIEPFSRDSLKEILVAMRESIAGGKAKVLFTNPSKIAVPSKTILSINKKMGINIVMHKDNSSDFRAVYFSEDSINEAFVDFVESIEGSGLVYTEADSLTTLDSVIRGL